MSDPFEPKPPAASLAGQPDRMDVPGTPEAAHAGACVTHRLHPESPIARATGLEACLLARADEPSILGVAFFDLDCP